MSFNPLNLLKKLLPPYTGLRFHFERLLLRGLGYRLLFASMLIASVALIGGFLVFMLDANFDDVGESVWWAFLRLTDPGYLGDDEGYVGRSISTVITVMGYVFFLGLLIAILTQWMNRAIQNMEAGITPVKLSDHVLILGWTHRTPYIVKELLLTRGRARRFLAAKDSSTLRVVILDELEDPVSTLQTMQQSLGDLWSDRLVILRHGSPLKMEDLERVSYDRAAVIILPGADFGSESPGAADAQALKTLHAIARHADESGRSRPLAVAGLYEPGRQVIAERTYGANTEILLPDELLSHTIAQSVLQPGLWEVYAELFNMNRGSAIYIRENSLEEASTFGLIRHRFEHAVPIGLIDSDDREPLLNPDNSHPVEPEDQLVFIAQSYEDCECRDNQENTNGSAQVPTNDCPAGPEELRRRILVLGWGRKTAGLLEALTLQSDSHTDIHLVGLTPAQERRAALRYRESPIELDEITFTEANFLLPHVLESLSPWEYDNVVILARERLGDEAYADAATVTAVLTLEQVLDDHERRPWVTVEIVEEENEKLLQGRGYDIVLSPMIVSYLLSQIALERELNKVFTELASTTGAQIKLKPLSHMAGETIDCDSLQRWETVGREINLGMVCCGHQDDHFLLSDAPEALEIQAQDRLIVLAGTRED